MIPLESPVRVEFIASLPRNEQEEIERGVAERASVLLRAARFALETFRRDEVEVEVKVWLATGCYPTCVTVHWEARLSRFYVLVMDGACRERLAAVVFENAPCVAAHEAEAESARFYEVLGRVVRGRREVEVMDAIAELQSEYRRTG